MDNRLQLLGESLDALPVNVSVLDPEGVILQTNQSWQEFGEKNGIRMRPDTAGVNYLEVCERSETETASAARRGLSELLAGRREQFQLEYPCHSPVEQRWFLLVAVPVTLDDQRHAVVAHLNITEQKRSERQLKQQVDRLERLTDLTTAVREITHTVIDQSTRPEIEAAVCAELAGFDYDCAQIGEVDGRTGTISVRASAGRCDGIATDSDGIFGETVIREAVWTGELQTTTNRRENPAFDWTQDIDSVSTERAVAAVPISHGETLYSVLTIYMDRPDAFGTDERTILTELGEVVGHAIADSERQQALMSDELIEVELRIPDLFSQEPSLSTDWTVEITQTIAGPDGNYIMYGTTTDAEIDAVAAVVDATEDVALTVIGDSHDRERVRIALELSRQSVIPLLAAEGWSTDSATLTNGDAYLTVHLQFSDNVRQMVETVCEEFPNTELLARRQKHVEPQTVSEIQQSAVAELTDRQRTILQTAHAAGYFEWPRDASGVEIAATLGISGPTFHQHLRVGQQKLMNVLFDELPVTV